ncbi:TPA: hypothetical protein KDX48_003016 [Vibrio parahaemolyticus]|uniref:hypothetical protein n=1 Tax=Vibrio parahaemolyticus TaxID=670 RepID=UPI001123260F|nr:hypothetical protein [Vibrio parahaemolyticus]MDQ2213440.1 hypothetical protein [Vibrio parahaemolyticus]TOG15417.1 hypothetical protein CGJ11_15765 [Vibrio parahaemolyticus]HAS6483958.1 hypothetical protein [Vibrio parahaemolyticus]HAV1386292.1 hypothetical protein [Vibrio parahaemolyticus]HBH7912671.1 hypothetical protein [Vibrio parahaemolyticus]
MNKKLVSLVIGSIFASPVFADTLSNPQIGVVLDGYYQDGQRHNSEREEGFGLGHTELSLSANIDDKFHGALTTVLESHADDTELMLEEAFIETLALPYGFNVRAGRFLSDFGYLNNQHMHTDSFVERPLAYRTFLGSHYYDDGVRTSLVLPTDLFVKFGVEALSGSKMSAVDEGSDVGVFTSTLKLGSDISDSSSWQFGLSYLRNKNGKVEEFADHDHHADTGHDHEHSHAATITGANLYGADFVWKWAPDGNYKYRNFTFSAEYMLLDGVVDSKFKDEAESPDNLTAYYVSGVYRFNPSWSAGVRYGEAESYDGHAHGDHMHFTALNDKEFDAMIAWNSSHFGTVRAQYTRAENQDKEKEDVFTLQYVMTFGAHGAHAF